jgi:hypothetical protein
VISVAEELLVLGPGEAKKGIVKEIGERNQPLVMLILTVETAEKMTDRQLAGRVLASSPQPYQVGVLLSADGAV